MAATTVSLRELADLAIGTPEVGAVNFTALHTLIVAILKNLNLHEARIDYKSPTPAYDEALYDRPARLSVSVPQLVTSKEKRKSISKTSSQALENQVKDLDRQVRNMESQIQGIVSHVQLLTSRVTDFDSDTPDWLHEPTVATRGLERSGATLMPDKKLMTTSGPQKKVTGVPEKKPTTMMMEKLQREQLRIMQDNKDSEVTITEVCERGPDMQARTCSQALAALGLLQHALQDVYILKEAHEKAQEPPEMSTQTTLEERIDTLEKYIKERDNLLDLVGRKLSLIPGGEEVTMVTWEELEQAITDGWKTSQEMSDTSMSVPKHKGQSLSTSVDVSQSGIATKQLSTDSVGGVAPAKTFSGSSDSAYPSERDRDRAPSMAGFSVREQLSSAHDEVGLLKPHHPSTSQLKVDLDRRRSREQYSSLHQRRDERVPQPDLVRQDSTLSRDQLDLGSSDQQGMMYLSPDLGRTQRGLRPPGRDQIRLVYPSTYPQGMVPPSMGQQGVAPRGMDQQAFIPVGMDQHGTVPPLVPGRDQQGLEAPTTDERSMVLLGIDQRGSEQFGMDQYGFVPFVMDQDGLVTPFVYQSGLGPPGLMQATAEQRAFVQPGLEVPGFVHPGAKQHDLAQPGAVQPGMVQPGAVQRGVIQPGAVQRGMVQPRAVQRGVVQPGAVQPVMVQSGAVQRGAVQPGAVQHGVVQPSVVQPGMVQPGAVQRGVVQPGAVQHGAVQRGVIQPDAVQPGMVQPGAVQLGAVQPGPDQHDLVQPGEDQPSLVQPVVGDQPGLVQPGLVQTGTDQYGLVQHGADQHDLAQPGVGQLDVVQPGMDQHGLMQLSADQHDLVQPEEDQRDSVPPGADQRDSVPPGADQRDSVPPGADQRDSVPPGADQRGIVQPGAHQRGMVQPGAHQHGMVQPGAHQRGLCQLVPIGLVWSNMVPILLVLYKLVPILLLRLASIRLVPHKLVLILLVWFRLVPIRLVRCRLASIRLVPHKLVLILLVRSRLVPIRLVRYRLADAYLPGSVQAGTYPPGSVQAGTYPPGSVQAGTYPPGSVQAGTYPPENAEDYSQRRNSLDKLTPSFPMAVETFRLMGEIVGLYVELKEHINDLDEEQAGQTDLEKIQYMIALMVKKSIPPDLQEQMKSVKTLAKEVRQEKAKLDRMQKILEGEGARETGKEIKTGQLGLQLGILRVTVADIEKELAELRESQEQGKISMEHSVSEASLYLQDQLDKLRTIIESMLTSSSTLLSMSMAPHKAPVTLTPGQIDPEATCPACSLDVSHQVSMLVQRYEQLQDMVNNLAASRPSKKAKLQSQDEELLGQVQSAILQVQGDCEKLNITTSNLIEDHRQKQKDIKVLYQGLEKLEKEKANREHLEMEIDVKADKSALAGKVSRAQFDATTEQLNHMMQELVAKMSGQEQDWQKMLDRLLVEMDSKLDRLELDPVKQLLEDRWKSLRQQLKERSPLYQADEAAAMRRQLLAHFHCLSCDRPLETPVTGQSIPVTPVGPGLPGHRSTRPYTIFELEQVRQQSRNQKLGSAFPRGDLGLMERSVGRLHTMHSKMLMDIEKVQIHFGGSVKASSQMIRELLHAQCLSSPCYKRVPDLADYTYSSMPRRCGGSHTLTYPYRRNRLQHLAQGLLPTEEIQIAMKHDEVDILGLDGHIYKGRMDTRLPGILTKDTPGVAKHKSKQSRVHVHRQQSVVNHGQLPSRPQSAQTMAGNTSAPSRQRKGRPVSSEGRFSQSNLVHPLSPTETEPANLPAGSSLGLEMPMNMPSQEGVEEPTRGPRSTTAH
ncbi:PREDICTED: glutamine-rich protein 2 [Chrysochloris asiatica]|uniref:Glutamine-rich protein 2 n=1 Tax=Chrysochloris asiatica TaxID=185453 RepID=A0A9B0TVZ4_CHRAS|nr:PREDICTED: glutamine-rich protein 2 [Chrysochloris asiatica]